MCCVVVVVGLDIYCSRPIHSNKKRGLLLPSTHVFFRRGHYSFMERQEEGHRMEWILC